VSNVVVEDHTIRMRVSGSIAPVIQTAARFPIVDLVSREPSLEETFLAEYGRGTAEVA
jgi:ABC-2 type transport system ATP-binding protein